MAEQEACRVPAPIQEHGLRAVFHRQRPMAVQPTERGRLQREAEVNSGLLLHQLLDVLDCPCLSSQAGHAQGKAIAGENFGKALANHGGNAPALQRLGGMFTAGAAAKIPVDDQNPGSLVLRSIKRMVSSRCCAVIGKDMVAQPCKADALQETGWNNAIRIDVMAWEGNRLAFHHGDGRRRHSTGSVSVFFAVRSMVRTSVTTPLTAAAATIAGLISKVRPADEP